MEATNNTSGTQIHAQATLRAPIELVWKVWTDPAHIAHWWGPEGFTNTIQQMDLIPGGEWRLTMIGPDGKRYPNRSEFVEMVLYKRSYSNTITRITWPRSHLSLWQLRPL